VIPSSEKYSQASCRCSGSLPKRSSTRCVSISAIRKSYRGMCVCLQKDVVFGQARIRGTFLTFEAGFFFRDPSIRRTFEIDRPYFDHFQVINRNVGAAGKNCVFVNVGEFQTFTLFQFLGVWSSRALYWRFGLRVRYIRAFPARRHLTEFCVGLVDFAPGMIPLPLYGSRSCMEVLNNYIFTRYRRWRAMTSGYSTWVGI
jgi:hypothetical protein